MSLLSFKKEQSQRRCTWQMQMLILNEQQRAVSCIIEFWHHSLLRLSLGPLLHSIDCVPWYRPLGLCSLPRSCICCPKPVCLCTFWSKVEATQIAVTVTCCAFCSCAGSVWYIAYCLLCVAHFVAYAFITIAHQRGFNARVRLQACMVAIFCGCDTAILSQYCTIVRSLVKSLDHAVSDAICSNANVH